MKGTFHKSCDCRSCRLGRGTRAGQETHKRNERKLRRKAKRQLDDVVKGADPEGVEIAPISSPYTD